MDGWITERIFIVTVLGTGFDMDAFVVVSFGKRVFRTRFVLTSISFWLSAPCSQQYKKKQSHSTFS